MVFTPHQLLFGWSNQEKLVETGMQHVWGRGDVNLRFWWGSMREREQLEDLDVDGRKILK